MINHPAFGVYDVFAGLVPTLKVVPTMHLNYSQAVLSMSGGSRKYKDFPSELNEFGGSGELMVE
ncbi:MAG: hypothetical protein ACI915_000916 [Gammaproteobacteria bacterium]|jgi:hypothetical protein